MRKDVVVFLGLLMLFLLAAHLHDPEKNVESPSEVVATTVDPGSADAGIRGDQQNGQDIATSLCGGCHAIPPAKTSPLPAAPTFVDVANRWPVENLAEALAEGIVVSHEGHVIMPEFSFTAEQVDDLLAYMNSLRG